MNNQISIGSHFEQFIQEAIAHGRYNSKSEVICAGLRLLEEDEANVNALKAALKEGEESGFVVNFDPEENLKQLKAKRNKRRTSR